MAKTDGIEMIEGSQPVRRGRFTAEKKRRLVAEAVPPVRRSANSRMLSPSALPSTIRYCC